MGAVSMTVADMKVRANTLLGQSTNATALKRVSDAQLLDFFNEAQILACYLGKVWATFGDITLATGNQYYTLPSTDVDSTPCSAVEVMDVLYSGETLVKINSSLLGKFYTDDTHPIGWFMFGDRVFIHPAPGATENSTTATVMFYGLPTTAMSADGHSPTIPTEKHPFIVDYATYRGKLVYKLHAEAEAYLKTFANGMGINIDMLQTKTENKAHGQSSL